MNSARVRYLAIGEEDSYGQEGSITDYIDIASSNLDTPDDQAIIWEGVSERAGVVHAPGLYVPSGEIVLPVDAQTTGYLFKWALGSVDTSEIEQDVYRHVFTPTNELKSFTVGVGKDIFEHKFIGAMIDSLEMEVEDSFASITASIIAQKDMKANLNNPIYNEISYFTFAQTNIMIGNETADVERLNLSIANNLDGEAGVILGSRHPSFIPLGAREVSISLDLTFKDIKYLEKFWGGTDGPVSVPTHDVIITMTGPPINNNYNYKLEILIPKFIFMTSNQEISGRDRIVQTVEGKGLFDRTLGYDIQITLLNNQPTY